MSPRQLTPVAWEALVSAICVGVIVFGAVIAIAYVIQ